jgi:hypothetical protein
VIARRTSKSRDCDHIDEERIESSKETLNPREEIIRRREKSESIVIEDFILIFLYGEGN